MTYDDVNGELLARFGFGSILASFLTVLSLSVGLWFGWITEVSGLEAFAVWTSYLCTYLCVVQSRWNYPIGVVTCSAYAVLFYQSGLIGSTALNLYLILPLVYGWFRWGKDTNTRLVTSLKWDWWLLAYAIATLYTFYLAWVIIGWFGGTLPAADGAILLLTILAQYLLDNKKIQTWFVWAAVNVTAIYVYSSQELYLVAFQYIFFLANTAWGYVAWRSHMEYQGYMMGELTEGAGE